MHVNKTLMPRIHAHFLRAAAGLGFLAAGMISMPTGCGGVEDPCPGGIIRNGVCETKCGACADQNTCVDNRCRLQCTGLDDCAPGQTCVPTKDDGGNDVSVCLTSGSAAFGLACPFAVECTNGICLNGGQVCNPTACAADPANCPCPPAECIASTTSCKNGSFCSLVECGGKPEECKRDDAECGDDPDCIVGKCGNGDPCKVSACPAAECKPMTCNTAGEGDANGYCTLSDCASDTDCATGFTCATVRDPRMICGTQKGDNKLCGLTTQPCLDPANFGDNGGSFFEGSACLLRKQCVKRDECRPCETDLDCSLFDTHRCIDRPSTGKICARDCGTDTDCQKDYRCDAGSCIPRYDGGCRATAQKQFCAPCLDDEDCGSKGSTWVCYTISADQKACLDASFSDTCVTSADCPTSPSGKKGSCQDGACYFPYTAGKFSCW